MAEKMHKVIPEKYPTMAENRKMKIYPTFQLDDEDLPELKEWEVGGKYKIVMEVEQLSMRQGNEWQGAEGKDKKIHATFKVLSVGVEEETYAEEYTRRRSGANKK